LALAALVVGADMAVDRLIRLAAYFRLSTTFVGMTVVSLATSIPEITAHFTASAGILRGTIDYEVGSAIVLGANIGSDVVQQTLIMAIVVIMAGSLYFRRYFVWKSLLPMILTAVLCIILGWDGTFSRGDGLVLFGAFVGYTYYLYWDERRYFRQEPAGEAQGAAEPQQSGRGALRDGLVAMGTIVVAIVAAQVVLNVTELVVGRTGIGGSLIGAVTLGVASALPELTTAISGMKSKAQGISLGTLVGSNITNPLVAIGGGAMLSTYRVPGPVLYWDLPWQAFGGLLLWLILLVTKGRLNRVGALYLISMYVIYLVIRATFFAVD
jgi:cation:H+ antiporter